MTDYKQLCAELLCAMNEIEECEAVDWSLVKTQPLKMANQSMAEVRNALAEPEPEPEGPTNEDLFSLDQLRDKWNAQADAFNTWDELGIDEIVWWAQHQALARWGNHPGLPDSSTLLS